MTDVNTLACTLYGEARGEGYDGQVAVANVVMNRVALAAVHAHFGNGDVTSCCLAPWQFSCWNANDPNLKVIQSVDATDPIFAQCLTIAGQAIANTLADTTNGATFYYAKGSPVPAWARGRSPCADIGRHLFFTNIP